MKTTKQRREIYLKAIEFIGEFGLCFAISEAAENSDAYYRQLRKDTFPEFDLFDPMVEDVWDWDNNARIICLLLCAEMCKP